MEDPHARIAKGFLNGDKSEKEAREREKEGEELFTRKTEKTCKTIKGEM